MKNWNAATIVFLCLIGQSLFSQGIEHRISFPMISYVQTNIPEFGGYLNTDYYSENYIPNIRYEVQYKSFILGVDHFNSYNYNEASALTKDEWNITNLNINSYSIFGGYQLFDRNKIKVKGGAGVSYNPSVTTTYAINYFFEGDFHYEYNEYGAMFWSSIDYRLSDSFFVAFNLRYSPMFRSFWDESSCVQCIFPHEKNKVNYISMQLSVGYSF